MEIFPYSVCIDSEVLKAFEHTALFCIFRTVWNNAKQMQVKIAFMKKFLPLFHSFQCLHVYFSKK